MCIMTMMMTMMMMIFMMIIMITCTYIYIYIYIYTTKNNWYKNANGARSWSRHDLIKIGGTLCFSSSVIFLLVDACVGLNWLLVSFLSHVNKNIIHSFSFIQTGLKTLWRLTAKSDVAWFPTYTRISGVAPESNSWTIRVATVVIGGCNGSIGIHRIRSHGMCMRRLRWPCLTCSAVHCCWYVSDVLLSWRRWIAYCDNIVAVA